MGWWVEDRPAHKSASTLMLSYRMGWMREMARREPRILDGNLLGGLQNSASFFASTALLGLGGLLAMLGQAQNLDDVAHALPLSSETTPDGLRLRLIAPLFFIAYAFFKFAWAQRLFGYCSVLIGATPEWDEMREAEIMVAASVVLMINRREFHSESRAAIMR